MLTIVPTPIGNLKDITLRAIEVLQNADEIICEDSRRTSLLLSHYQIKKPLIILNDFNEFRSEDGIIAKLRMGLNLALVSDAGTPLISDPGYKIIRAVIEQGLEVDSLPGASSVITALTLSGLPPDKFMFIGYLPEKEGRRKTQYQNLLKINKLIPTTFIIFVAPHKLIKTLQELEENLSDPKIVLAKELTKIHQEVKTKRISEFLEEYKKRTPKGEFILMLNLNTA
jgi:16S rRNA (cytidine1402-2'-O)-methyltransferase